MSNPAHRRCEVFIALHNKVAAHHPKGLQGFREKARLGGEKLAGYRQLDGNRACGANAYRRRLDRKVKYAGTKPFPLDANPTNLYLWPVRILFVYFCEETIMESGEDRIDLDLNKVSVKELEGLDNPVLKRVLLQVKKHLEEEATDAPPSMDYYSFNSHNVFYNYGG
jgi:hypothetical protein